MAGLSATRSWLHPGMFCIFAKRLRARAAIAAVALYVISVLAPHAALAATGGTIAMHCLNDLHGIVALHGHDAGGHAHRAGTVHAHHDESSPSTQGDGDGHPGDCCGLFCISALASDASFMMSGPLVDSPDFVGLTAAFSGREPERLYRPPIV